MKNMKWDRRKISVAPCFTFQSKNIVPAEWKANIFRSIGIICRSRHTHATQWAYTTNLNWYIKHSSKIICDVAWHSFHFKYSVCELLRFEWKKKRRQRKIQSQQNKWTTIWTTVRWMIVFKNKMQFKHMIPITNMGLPVENSLFLLYFWFKW